jgi:hypothetical protein
LSKPGEKKYIDIFYDIDAHGRYRGGYITYHRAGGDSVGAFCLCEDNWSSAK